MSTLDNDKFSKTKGLTLETLLAHIFWSRSCEWLTRRQSLLQHTTIHTPSIWHGFYLTLQFALCRLKIFICRAKVMHSIVFFLDAAWVSPWHSAHQSPKRKLKETLRPLYHIFIDNEVGNWKVPRLRWRRESLGHNLGPEKKIIYFEWSPPWHVGWGLSGECLSTLWNRHFKTYKPATLVFWNFACSCGVLPALQYSTCHKCLRKQDTNMSENKHAKTCQYTTWQKQTCQNMPKQTCQNMAVECLNLFQNSNLPKHVSRPPVRSVWADSTNTEHYIACQKCLSKHDNKHSSALLEAFSYTKHAKTCQDTICQTCQNMSGYHLSNMFE